MDELFFNDVKIPLDNIIGGGEGQGFVQPGSCGAR